MEISVAVYGILAALAVGEAPLKKRGYKTALYWGGAVLLISMAALRDFSVGPDTKQYLGENGFLEIMALPWHQVPFFKWELGYTLLNKIVGTIYCNQRFLLIVVMLVALVPVFYRLFRDSRWATLSLVCVLGTGIWETSAFLMRQGCAMAILTFSYRYCKERKFLPFLGCVIAAMLFHRTAAVWLLLYFVYPLAINGRTLVACAVASFLCGIAGPGVFYILRIFARNEEQMEHNGGLPMLVVLWLCVVTVFVLHKGKIPEQDRLYYWMLLLAAVMQPVAFTFSNFARIVVYFRLAMVVLLPNTLQDFLPGDKNRGKRAAAGALLCAVLFVWYATGGVTVYKFGL